MKPLAGSSRDNRKRTFSEAELCSCGGDSRNQNGESHNPEDMRLEQPATSLRLARDTNSDYLENSDLTPRNIEFMDGALADFEKMGALMIEITELSTDKDSKVIDIKNKLSQKCKYAPSELSVWCCESNQPGTKLDDDVLLCSLESDIDVAVVIVTVRSYDIARQVRAVFKDDPIKFQLGAAVEQLSAIIEPLSENSVADMKCLVRSLTDMALSDGEYSWQYVRLFCILSNNWYRSTGALSERHVVKTMLGHVQDEWDRIISVVRDPGCEGICLSNPITDMRLYGLAGFITGLVRFKLFPNSQIIVCVMDLMSKKSSRRKLACNAQVVCAAQLFVLALDPMRSKTFDQGMLSTVVNEFISKITCCTVCETEIHIVY